MRFTPVLFNVIRKPPQAGTIFGLDAHPNPRPTLLSLYRRILSNVGELPESAAYRRSVEATTQRRLRAAEAAASVDQFVAEIDAGLVEELIVQAQDELALIARLKVEKVRLSFDIFFFIGVVFLKGGEDERSSAEVY
ncbi:hypothetical protein HK405_000928 [Cladochytrium tenue]|nr:hypothetical protein HK405_000928 [Cladochytrium tenue]